MEYIIVYSLVIIALVISFIFSKKKTKMALKKALKSFVNLLPALVPLMILVGFILTYLGQDVIMQLLGSDSGFSGVVIALVIGSVAFMPGFVAFPIGAALLQSGAGYPQVAAFVASLMSVGLVSAGVELKYFGKKATIVRNVLGLVIAIVFSVVVWVVM